MSHLLFRFTCLLAAVCFNASETFAQKFYFGLRGAYNLVSLEGDDKPAIDVSRRSTFTVATVFDYKFEYIPWGISIEPGYTRKGAQIARDTIDYKFHFINAPLLVNFYPTTKLKISFGPEIGYLHRAKNIVNDKTKRNLLDVYKNRWELSGTVGVSYSLDFFVDAGVRYSRSFTPIADLDPMLESRNLYTQYLQVFLLFKVAN